MDRRIVLLYFPSRYIVEYISKHPIDWGDRELARRGGDGDRAGIPPTPSVQEFLSLLSERRELFTQREFWDYCAAKWQDWLDGQVRKFQTWPEYSRPRVVDGLRAKAFRNFYPSMIDSLHAWSMLSETGMFDRCIMDTYDDATGKSDITVTGHGVDCRIALIGPTKYATQDRTFKEQHRAGYEDANKSVLVQMPEERERQPGNKRWYRPSDFLRVYTALSMDYYQTTTPKPQFTTETRSNIGLQNVQNAVSAR